MPEFFFQENLNGYTWRIVPDILIYVLFINITYKNIGMLIHRSYYLSIYLSVYEGRLKTS